MYNTDILIIGAGAVGTAIARELSRYNVKVLVVDKNDDVGGDASKACSSIVGVGDGNTPNSLECKLAHASRMMFNKLCDDLDIPINHCGKIMPAVTKEQHSLLQKRLDNAFINGDYDLEYVTGPEILAMEPGINPEVLGGIYSPRDSVIDLFLLVVALAENAAENGVEFLLNCKVQGIDIHNGRIECVKTTRGDIKTKYVINAAGLHCDDIARMVNECDFKVNPRKGQFFILDKNTPCKVKHIIAPIPTPLTRGTIMLPTVHGNMLVGPTAEDLEDKEDKKVTTQGLEEIERNIRQLVPNVVLSDAITQFSGLRPNRVPEGYFIGLSKETHGYLGISGIRSDGLSTSLGIAKYVVRMLTDSGYSLEKKNGFIRHRRGIIQFAACNDAQRDTLISEDPLYGHVICRCETVTESEIVQAIHRPVGARSVDAIKRRVRAGMGRCQGGFCGPRVIEILSRELGVSPTEITKNHPDSKMVDCKIR